MTDPSSPSAAADLASFIDHTLLKPDACPAEVDALCAEAVTHGFKAVCVNPLYLPRVTRAVAGSAVVPCAVICFPFGADPTAIKAAEAAWVVEQGAGEVDMVIPIGLLRAGEDGVVRDDIAAVKAACGPALLKVILETALLTREEKVRACLLAKDAGADFVKTSTGFAGGGATVEDVALMRETVGPEMGVKASGGVRTTEDARRMIAAGATRIGASASIAIIGGA